MPVLRFLIHPEHDSTYPLIVSALESAVSKFPDSFDRVVNQPATVDHYGYGTEDLSSVVLSPEYNSAYMRLVIRPGEHVVFDELLDIVLRGE